MPRKQTQRLPHPWRLLFEALLQATAAPPANMLATVQALPPAGTLPSPWETWLLLSLFEYRERQLWARRRLRERLPETVPPSGELWAQDQPIKGHLPGLPEWEITLECTEPPYAVLHHRVTGERIFADISALGGTRPLVFLNTFPLGFPRLAEPTATTRLRELCSWFDRDVRLNDIHAERCLVNGGLLDEVFSDPTDADRNLEPEGHRLSRLALRHSSEVRRFHHVWQQSADRLWLAALVGDWLLAAELARQEGNHDLIAVTNERALACRAHRLDAIRRSIGSDPASTMDLLALHALRVADLDVYVGRGLASDGWGQGAIAFFLEDCDVPAWCELVFDWLRTQRCGSDRSGCERTLVRYLVKHGYESVESLRLLAENYGEPAEAAMIALQHAPELASSHVRASLRCRSADTDSPMMAVLGYSPLRVAAVAMAVIDTPGAHKELRAALNELESDAWPNRFRALPLILALCESSDPKAPADMVTWEHLYDAEELQECRRHFRDSMDMDQRRLPWLSSVPL